MQEANIGIFDDMGPFRRITADMLDKLGHRVLINAGTRTESIAAIEELTELLDIALVDGNLDPNSSPGSDDGVVITRLLREKFGDAVAIVSVSGNGIFEGADAAISKFDTKAISDFVDQLPDRAQ
jgi:CheY-like chemotaxis protein